MKRKKIKGLIILSLMILGFFYRFYGLNDNHSFWTDEEHVAIFVREILKKGKPVLDNGFSTGVYQWLQYWLSAISAKIFGLNEFAVRFPSVLFGIMTIWAIYLLGQELFSKEVGLMAAFFTSFLKIEILWSRQARPYQALQFFFLLSSFYIWKFTKSEKFDFKNFLGFLICGLLASLMHGLGLVVFFVGFLYFFLQHPNWFRKWTLLFGALIGATFIYFFREQISLVISNLGNINNFFYYRIFLWHNYSLLVFLALIGFLINIFQKKKEWQILILFLIIQTLIVSLFLPKTFVRYFYVTFPFLILFSAIGLTEIAEIISKRNKIIALIILVFFTGFLGNKFVLIPLQTYSLNEDMQEIPEVDYKKIYAFIRQKLEQYPAAVYLSNWNDHPIWYLGGGRLDYLIRKRHEAYEKDRFSGAVYIENLEELISVISVNKSGIILLESWDDWVPEDIRKFIRENLKKEFEIDRLYSVQPRYWPVEIYSWGI